MIRVVVIHHTFVERGLHTYTPDGNGVTVWHGEVSRGIFNQLQACHDKYYINNLPPFLYGAKGELRLAEYGLAKVTRSGVGVSGMVVIITRVL